MITQKQLVEAINKNAYLKKEENGDIEITIEGVCSLFPKINELEIRQSLAKMPIKLEGDIDKTIVLTKDFFNPTVPTDI